MMKEELWTGIKRKLLRKQISFYVWVRSLKSEQNKPSMTWKKTAYDLWTALAGTCTRMNTQGVQNLHHNLDMSLYSDGAEWDEDLSKFIATVLQLDSLVEEFSEK